MQETQHSSINLSRRIRQLLAIARKANLKYLVTEIESLDKKRLDEDFYVAIVGQFKRGKSSLINSLLGSPLAPVAVTPLTSAVTVFAHGSRCYGDVSFTDGSKKEVMISELASYISEDLNAENHKQVLSTTAYCDAPILRYLSLIDTPGLGSVYEHNNETTLRFIPKIDVALLVLSADTPVSKADLEFLAKVKTSVQRFVFVLNKCDLLDEQQLAKLLDYNRKAMATELAIPEKQLELIPVSSKSIEQANGIEVLYNALKQMALSEKSTILAASTERLFTELKLQATNMLKLELDILLTPVKTLEAQLATFRSSHDLLVKGKGEFQQLVEYKIKEIDKMVHHAIIDEATTLKELIAADLQEKYPNAGPAKLQKENLKEHLDRLILDHYTKVKKDMERKIKAVFNSVLEDFNQRSRSFFNELIRQLSFLMHIDLDMLAKRFDLNVYTSFYLTLNMEHSPVHDRSWYFFLFDRSAQRVRSIQKWQKHYEELLVINNAAVIYDLQYKAQEALRQFTYDLNGHFYGVVQYTEDVINQALNNKDASAQATEVHANELKALISEVTAL